MSWIPISNQGIPGPAGPTGPQGTAGTSINLKGEVPTESALPTVGNQINDGYITVDTGDLWVWTSSLTWANAGTIVGPEGPTGSTGPTGSIGPTGPLGINSIPYTLSGTSGGGVIVNRATGSGNSLPQNIFTLISQITFNLPTILNSTDSVYYDGWNLCDFSANFNSFWGVSYITNTFSTPTDLIGSTTVTTNALNFSNIQQIYLPLNVIIPPTHITAGGTVTLSIYCSATSTNHFLTIPPINTARIGVVKD